MNQLIQDGKKLLMVNSILIIGKPCLILGTSPSPMGAKLTVENAAKCYPWLGAKVTGSVTVPNFY